MRTNGPYFFRGPSRAGRRLSKIKKAYVNVLNSNLFACLGPKGSICQSLIYSRNSCHITYFQIPLIMVEVHRWYGRQM